MPLYAKANVTHDGREVGKVFEPCPEGVQSFVCVDVVDIGLVDVVWLGQTRKRHKIQLRWQSEHQTADGKPFLLTGRYTLSMHEKSSLRSLLQAWRGKNFDTDREAEEFDIETVIGKHALANIVHKRVGDRIYANIAAIMPLPKNHTSVTPRDYVRVCDRPGYVPVGKIGIQDDDRPAKLDDEVPF
jgi:hypothetical protein